ncbi:MAG: tRNA epoxyqueuosine(34) reductase QueG [Pseudobacteriovorax sp.]|nr:tRNA epoxyqueuosine(34) reductase QueG [Pseudobacteriovorax sp.]
MLKLLDNCDSFRYLVILLFNRDKDMINLSQISSIFNEHSLILLGCQKLAPDHKSYEILDSWLDDGRHGEMHYLENHLHLRKDPSKIEPEMPYAISIGQPYKSSLRNKQTNRSKIASYAVMKDYHKFLRRRIEHAFLAFLKTLPSSSHVRYRILVDTAPILERNIAAKTHSGFIGKNTCFIHPEHGSFMFLSELLTNLDLTSMTTFRPPIDPHKRGERGGCGTCRRCQVKCPTNALSSDYKIDASRCISYWTIEHRGLIPLEFWRAIGQYWYGCDICQDVCPYNRQKANYDSQLPLRPDLAALKLSQIATMSQTDYENWFGGTPMTRAKRRGLQRNAIIAMTVNKDPELVAVLGELRDCQEELVAGTIDQIRKYAEFGANERT